MSCADCKGSTPASWWKRCEECAMIVARFIMSGGEATSSPRPRRRKRGDRVLVVLADCAESDAQPGKVVRVRDDGYTVDLDRGGRCYVGSLLLRDPVVAPGQHLPATP